MAYDTALTARVRAPLPSGSPMRDKPMFGGLALLTGRLMRNCSSIASRSATLREAVYLRGKECRSWWRSQTR